MTSQLDERGLDYEKNTDRLELKDQAGITHVFVSE